MTRVRVFKNGRISITATKGEDLRGFVEGLAGKPGALTAEHVPTDMRCTRTKCPGMVECSDNAEIYDGTEGRCVECGRLHVAVEWQDGTIGMVHRKEARRGK